ncbi:general substrate transporter [Lentinula raphanica]|uniref:General substrate transporter n=1 Tax=Lentinula raphanica TaxID=153919 RepID=A0AA38P340_9AGAR|nr:general substrate transporter [Lentinula raphanica]KAJ3764320.1 general substrate transporter [Lentinula raphanica]KAJ3777624.1 general substrate transporter [Lentinula raphanica]KAJ3824029.1 general substrate transporter [Lentinula raphanica]KAJ3835414.1 general substrate transporter [Lentinula raphanica]
MHMSAGNEAFRSIPNKDSHLPWYKNAGLLQLNLFLLCIFTGQFLNGYDGALISSFQAMNSWLTTLGLKGSSDKATNIGLLNAAVYLAGLCISPFAAWVSDRFGRKWCIRYSSIANLIGTAIGAAAGAGSTNGYAMFMMSRIIIGSGLAFCVMISPIMLQELPHPKHRVLMAGLFDVAYIAGSFVSAWVTFGCSYISNDWAWRIPYLIHLPFAAIMIILISLVPESPRWLFKQGREEEGKAFMVKYHANGGENDELVAFEVSEIKEALRIEREAKQDTWKMILSSRSSLHRLACVVLIVTMQNLSGTAIIAYYYTSILKLVGITQTSTQTGINAGLTSFTVVMALLGVWLTKRIRRKTQIYISWTGVLLSNIGLIVSTALYTQTGHKSAGLAAVFFVWIYNGSFFLSCGPIFFSYPAEVLHLSMRSKGMMIWTICGKVMSVFSSYVNPVAMTNIAWKWYFFYTAILVVTGILAHFVLVETKGRTLEEIGELFDGKMLQAHVDPTSYELGSDDEKMSEKSLKNV